MPALTTPTQPRQAVTVVVFNGPVLDEQTMREVSEHLLSAATESGGSRLHLDLGGVNYASAGGVGGLIALRRRLLSLGVDLTLDNVQGRVYEVFRLTRLTQLLNVEPKRASVARRHRHD